MIVFVEGPNGAGKSTLCAKFKEYGIKVLKPVPAQETNAELLWDDMIQCNQSNPVLCDRSPVSELIYRLHDLKMPSMSINTIFKLLETNQNKVKFIFVKNNSAYERSQFAEKNKYITKGTHEYICTEYNVVERVLRQFTSIPIITVDTTDNKIDMLSIVKFILEGDVYGI